MIRSIKVAISLATKGANENGLIEMYRRPMAERTAFDVVVKPGEYSGSY